MTEAAGSSGGETPVHRPRGERVAFLGLGAMGLPMASNLARAGFEVAGFDVRAERAGALAEAGGQAAGTPAEAAESADVVVAIPFDERQIRASLVGEQGAFATLPPGSLVILMSTIGPAAARDLAAEIVRAGHRVVDAPVTGGSGRAGDGTLTIIAAGAAADLDAAAPVFAPMGSRVFRVGSRPGQGQTIKLVNQLLVGTHIAAAAEAMALARAAGADLKQVFDLLVTGAGRSEMLVSRVGAFVDGTFDTGSTLAVWGKDMPLVLDAGRDLRVPLITAAAAFQTMQLGRAAGLEDLSDAYLVKLLADPAATLRAPGASASSADAD